MQSHRLRRALVLVVATAVVALGAAGSASAATVWLCKPGKADNPCTKSLTTTVVPGSGKRRVVRTAVARRPKVDCFYVYPTVSDQPTPNATRAIDPEIRAIARYQASPFSQACRVYAPVYRQLTLRGILDPASITPEMRATAYDDVVAAWREYLARYNRGRGVILIGHSQGTFVLRPLIAAEIDGKAAVRKRVVSALLLGGNVTVKKGRDRGGDFKNIPACRRSSQTGCVVAYSTFNATPPQTARFGQVTPEQASAGLEVLCTNPAALGGGSGALVPVVPYMKLVPFNSIIGATTKAFIGEQPKVSTPWIAQPGHYTARCSGAGGARTLQVSGSPRLTASPNADWGLHLGDANLAMGNLTALVRKQVAAYGR